MPAETVHPQHPRTRSKRHHDYPHRCEDPDRPVPLAGIFVRLFQPVDVQADAESLHALEAR
jgi:hypothetical protein